MVWSICIFAHNEERLLPRCLGALEAAASGADYVVHVMENGSRDQTARVARAIAAIDPRIHVHELAIGDKANAWNDYVHRVAGEADMHIFIDGDVQPAPGAFKALAAAFESAPDAYGAAGLPACGRSRRKWATRLFEKRYLSGNLYALAGNAVGLIREREICFPVGTVGEDGLLTYLLLTDLKGGADDGHRDRIVIAAGAFFEFDPLAPNARDLSIYRGRLHRYSRRFYQNEILYDLLKTQGVDALPEHIDEIFTIDNLAPMRPRLDPQFFLVDRRILRLLRAIASKRAA